MSKNDSSQKIVAAAIGKKKRKAAKTQGRKGIFQGGMFAKRIAGNEYRKDEYKFSTYTELRVSAPSRLCVSF